MWALLLVMIVDDELEGVKGHFSFSWFGWWSKHASRALLVSRTFLAATNTSVFPFFSN